MLKLKPLFVFSTVVLSILSGPALSTETAEEIRDCVRANAPDSTSTQEIELRSIDRGERQRTLQARLYWKKHEDQHVRLMIRIDSPRDLRGSSYLVIENQPRDTVYAFLPALGRSRRIAGGGAREIWSTDFAYEDLRLLQMKNDNADIERLEDAAVDGEPVYVIAQTPDPERESGFDRVVLSVDKKNCVVVQTQYYEPGNKLRKTLLADEIKAVGSKWVAHRLEMTDVRDNTQSWITVENISFDEPLSARYFSIGQYYR